MAQGKTCHFKLVLLGDTAVGKSCLVVRFVRDEFFEFQEPTIGGSCTRRRRNGRMGLPHNRLMMRSSRACISCLFNTDGRTG